MRPGTLFLLPIVILVLVACSTPVPTPTPTRTFEQVRTAVVTYLKAFNGIHNSSIDAVSTVQFPASTVTAQDLLAYNQAVDQVLVALKGVLARMTDLQPLALAAPETLGHLNIAKNTALAQQQSLDELKQALAAGDQTRISQAIIPLAKFEAQFSAFNRVTEQVLLKYNISDAEVGYRFRGK